MKGFTAWLRDKARDIWGDLKGAYKSWTIRFNGVSGALIIALPIAQENLPTLQEYLSPEVYKQAMIVLIVGNILLRFRTTSALRHK